MIVILALCGCEKPVEPIPPTPNTDKENVEKPDNNETPENSDKVDEYEEFENREVPPVKEYTGEKIIVGYITYWEERMPDPTLLTHINYAFAHIKDDFESLDIKSPSRLKEVVGLKKQNPNLNEEVRVLGKLETRDVETFVEREHFFNRQTIARVIKDYLVELKKYVDNLPTKKCKGVPYKRIKGTNIFVADLDKKLYLPVERCANKILCAKDYNNVYYTLRDFMNSMVKLPYDTSKSAAWIDAFKGAGAYYTLKNLVMFHNCGIKVAVYDVKFGMDAVGYLHEKLDAYKGGYYRMFALMKKVIADNGLDTKTYIKEICNK